MQSRLLAYPSYRNQVSAESFRLTSLLPGRASDQSFSILVKLAPRGLSFRHAVHRGRSAMFLIVFLILLLCGMGCGVLKEKEEPMPLSPQQLQDRPLSPAQAEQVLNETGKNWLYGPGLGSAVLNIGGIVLFPPYAIYVLGNGLVSAAGYEPVYVSDALPEKTRAGYNEVYDAVTSVPGKFAAAAADEEFRSKAVADAKIKAILNPPKAPSGKASPHVRREQELGQNPEKRISGKRLARNRDGDEN